MIVDTHAHLDMLEDPISALRNAGEAGVGLLCTVVNVLEAPERTFEGLESWREAAGPHAPETHIIVGTHPHDAARTDEQAMDDIRRFAQDPRVVGLGEIGLDYHYDHSPRDVQRDIYAQQLQLAHELDLPVCIHLREAHGDGLRILTEQGVPAQGAILHCFGLEYEVAQPFLDLGCYVSFAGPITFKKAAEVRDAAARIPLDRLLSETDSPFLSPEPHRGKKNEPARVRYIVNALAQAHDMSEGEMADITLTNARRFFGLS
ncbi:MAG: TatD family hydrolase [Actinomycetia bacterium]|nr:TatD family hydrolase [Actinomycetes bacterium]